MKKRSEAMAMRKRSEVKPSKPAGEAQRKYTGEKCSVCGHLQFETPSGVTCANGHGGADGLPITGQEELAKPKTSAAERTLPIPGTELLCTECTQPIDLTQATERADGTRECPMCGAPVPAGMDAGHTPPPASIPVRAAATTSSSSAAPARTKSYCPECGTEWPLVNGSPFRNCGHKGEPIDDPAKAKSYGPPAGHPRIDLPPQTRAGTNSSPPEMPTPAPTFTLTGKLLRVDLGKMVFRLADYGVNLTVGPFSATVEVENGDITGTGAKVLKDLRALADTAFAEQLAWYCSRLGIIAKRLETA